MNDGANFEVKKVLGRWDILVISFGAMIGWGWVVSSGDWILKGGIAGAAIGFVIGGLMILMVGLTYAELTTAIPKCGGEHVFSFRALGPRASFVCTWCIILGYVSVVCFESCTLPLVFQYLYPDFFQIYLYTIGGFDVYATWLISAALVAAGITYINIRGIKMTALVQAIFTVIIVFVGVLMMFGSAVNGDADNISNFMFRNGDEAWHATLLVAMVTPFYFIGFDVIPQAAGEISIPAKKIGRILITSIIIAITFYALIVVSVGAVLGYEGVVESNRFSLTTADAMALAFNSSMMSKVALVGGLCGIITSWNAFMIGGSRAMFSMARAYMIPPRFGRLSKYGTPVNALLIIGLFAALSPLLGRKALVWLVDAGNLACCMAYFMVALSFLVLRKKEPLLERPYRIKHPRLIGGTAMVLTIFFISMYIIPKTGATLLWEEWLIVGGWSVFGIILCVYSMYKYGKKFGTDVGVYSDNRDFG